MQENVPVFVTPNTLASTYTSRPVRIIAVQWDGTEEQGRELVAWVESRHGAGAADYLPAHEARSDWEGNLTSPALPARVILENGTSLLAGSWLIEEEGGTFSSANDSAFRHRYAAPIDQAAMPDLIDTDRLYATTDAAVWAAEFVKVQPGIDEGFMTGWFAAAIETAKQAARG